MFTQGGDILLTFVFASKIPPSDLQLSDRDAILSKFSLQVVTSPFRLIFRSRQFLFRKVFTSSILVVGVSILTVRGIGSSAAVIYPGILGI